MEGKFSPKYFLFGKGKESWFKTAGYGWRLLLILFAIFVIWRAFFMKTTSVHVGSGGTAIINQARKRFLIPFTEVFTGKEKNYPDLNYGVKVGVRFEF